MERGFTMKKNMVYASVLGLILGVTAYILSKKFKSKGSADKPIENEFNDLTSEISEQKDYEPDAVEEMVDAKSSSAYSIHERHEEAANIMFEAFENIYKDIEPIECDEKKAESIIDETEPISDELDTISAELDDLLKQE